MPSSTTIQVIETVDHVVYTTYVRGAQQTVVVDKSTTQTAQEEALGNAVLEHSRMNYDPAHVPTGPGGAGTFSPPQ